MSQSEYKLKKPPTDGITRVFFSFSDPNILLVSSWDKSLSVYDTRTRIPSARLFQKAAILDCSFLDSTRCFSGGLDSTLYLYDLEKQKQTIFGKHSKAIRCVNKISESLVATGSWDQTIKIWDTRSSNCVRTLQTQKKVYTMDVANNGEKIICACDGLRILIFDIRVPNNILTESRKSPLLHQSRCVKNFRNDEGYAIGSTEGRVAIEFYSTDLEVQKRRYAFKCHRIKKNEIDTLYPVNCLCFHPTGSMLTGGCDGKVISWDIFRKKRIRLFKTVFPTSIASLGYNCKGEMLAIASSYTFEMGEKEGNDGDNVFIKNVDESHYVYSKKTKKN